jgi:hypothetical protein
VLPESLEDLDAYSEDWATIITLLGLGLVAGRDVLFKMGDLTCPVCLQRILDLWMMRVIQPAPLPPERGLPGVST